MNNKFQLSYISGAWRHYFITICSALLIFGWSYRTFQDNGSEDGLVGFFVLFGVILCLAIFSLRRTTYRRIQEMDPKAFKKMMDNRGKQRPLELTRTKNAQYSQQVEDMFRTYNIFRYFCLILLLIFLGLDVIILQSV